MLKKISVAALAGLLSLPAAAGAAPSVEQLQAQIEQMNAQLNELKQQMEEVKAASSEASSKVESMGENAEKWDLASRIKFWGDFRSRIDYVSADVPAHYQALTVGQGVADVLDAGSNFDVMLADFGMSRATPLGAMLAGLPPTPAAFIGAASTDFNADGENMSAGQATVLSNIFYNPSVGAVLGGMLAANPAATVGDVASGFDNTQNLVGFMRNLSASDRSTIFQNINALYVAANSTTADNDTMWTNRFRMNMQAGVTENVTFKGRLAMYKAWGMQNNPVDYQYTNGMGGGPFMTSSLAFDGSSTRQPEDNVLRVDRAYVNWSDIADLPVWFSIGRRPTTDGPPGHLRQGVDERMATPTAFMDYPFDGLTLGYQYESLLGMEDVPGRIRFCYGRGFESGPRDNSNQLRDVDFGGISWDVYDKGSRFFGFQSFIAKDMFNVPDGVTFPNPIEFGLYQIDPGFYDPTNPDRDLILNRANLGDIYHTTAVFSDKWEEKLDYFLAFGWSHTDPDGMDQLGTSLLGTFFQQPETQDGYSVYAGVRYAIPDYRLKLGLEYNYGSQYWIGFTPGHDDLYQGKLSTRGHVYEAYMVYTLPAGDKLSRYADFFMRLGYMHYNYNYTGSGFWLGEPLDVDELANDPLRAQFYSPINDMDQVYLSFDAYF